MTYVSGKVHIYNTTLLLAACEHDGDVENGPAGASAQKTTVSPSKERFCWLINLLLISCRRFLVKFRSGIISERAIIREYGARSGCTALPTPLEHCANRPG